MQSKNRHMNRVVELVLSVASDSLQVLPVPAHGNTLSNMLGYRCLQRFLLTLKAVL